jgi:hypothetical protein
MMNIYSVEGRLANSYIVEEAGLLFVVDVAMRGGNRVVVAIQNDLGKETDYR